VLDHLDLLDALSEREAFRYVRQARESLDHWLEFFDDSGRDATTWSHVLRVKGAISGRLRAARAMASETDETAALAQELREVRGRLAHLALSTAPTGNPTYSRKRTAS